MEPLPAVDAEILTRLDRFIAPVLHHAVTRQQRRALARTYVRGLLGPSARKNVEQIVRADRGLATAPAHEKRTTAMVREDDWRHDVVMWEGGHRLVAQTTGWCAYTLDDTALLKQGDDSVGVQVQYAGCVGHTANCQVLVTVGLAQEHASAPLAAQLFLPEAWARDAGRRAACHVPAHVAFQTKTAIALELVRRVDLEGLPHYPVLADSAYGDVVAFRAALTARGFPWVVGLSLDTSVWPAGLAFEPLPRRSHRGRPVVRVRPTTPCAPRSVAAFAAALPDASWQRVCWREGSRGPQVARFAAVRVRPAHGWDHGGIGQDELCDEAWLLLHWPDDKPAPTKAWLASLPPQTPVETLVGFGRLRWRVERDNREGKGLAGLDHYEGRTWHGLHHHAALVVLAQQFLATERLAALTAATPPPPAAVVPTAAPAVAAAAFSP
jgi:SRSO17 transposase